jgi:V/A-type H+-transporting ATPase subunit I
LLVAGGISSLIFGALYGSFFGLEPFKPLALWRDPLAGNPAQLMLAAIGVGMVVISLGLVLNIINCFRRRDFVGGWLDRFGVAGLVFYWGSLGLLAKLPTIQSLNLLGPILGVFIGLPIIGWILKDPLKFIRNRRAGRATAPDENWFAVMTESLVGAFEALLSFLANTISFVRLAAYAMSHAALLLAAFMLADALKRLPVGGTFLGVLVIILGNIVAMILEGVIACVQALRLEYYEFFSKFFPGGGRPFRPFRLRETILANSPN